MTLSLAIVSILNRVPLYWSLIKSPQTALLLATGLAGYMSARCPVLHFDPLLLLTPSLALAIAGSTVLNMWYDRDIDSDMARTCRRPLPAGRIWPQEALILGLFLAISGVGWAFKINPLYGLIVFAGFFFDVIVYTVWLKRTTCWSIAWGGISGGMPILAGRVLATGKIDWIGIAMVLAVLFWIPTHILTFSMRYHEDYRRAGIPTFPSTYGFQITRLIISISSVLATLMMAVAAYGMGMTFGYLRILAVLSAGLFLLAAGSTLQPSERLYFGVFKYASVYMLAAMLLVILAAI